MAARGRPETRPACPFHVQIRRMQNAPLIRLQPTMSDDARTWMDNLSKFD
jgi:hypothetical protein